MLQVMSIKPTAKAGVEQVELAQILDDFSTGEGRGSLRVWHPVTTGKHKFKVGQTIGSRKIVQLSFDRPMFDGHSPYTSSDNTVSYRYNYIVTEGQDLEALKNAELKKVENKQFAEGVAETATALNA